ncbi:MAG: carboxymuconolactone decarboxylase family protein [Oscillospiraceae bacterium]|nr:carboxymuconolactone decarboxylase family protein [Oscillospiraceae bacterium]
MAISNVALDYHEKMFPGYQSKFLETDPEFIERFDNFAFDEVVSQVRLDDRTTMMSHLAYLLGCQGVDEFRAMLPAALNFGVTPVEVKEIVYQAVAYLGIGRVFPFLHVVNDVLTQRGVALPLEPQGTTITGNRLVAEEQTQIDIFGEGMRGFAQSGPEENRHINRWLSDNCFGDYYDEFTSRDRFLTRQDWEGTFPVTHGSQDGRRERPFSEKNGYTWEIEVSDAIRDAIRAKGVGASMNPMTEEEAASKAGVLRGRGRPGGGR